MQAQTPHLLRFIKTLLTFTFFFRFTDRRRGGTQLSVSSKAGGLEKGRPLSSEGVCHGAAPSFSWPSSRSPARVLGVVCPEGGLVYRIYQESPQNH